MAPYERDCPYCGKTEFPSRTAWADHSSLVHTGLQCRWGGDGGGCAHAVGEERQMYKHLYEHNGDLDDGVCRWPGCGKELTTRNTLQRHLRGHAVRARKDADDRAAAAAAAGGGGGQQQQTGQQQPPPAPNTHHQPLQPQQGQQQQQLVVVAASQVAKEGEEDEEDDWETVAESGSETEAEPQEGPHQDSDQSHPLSGHNPGGHPQEAQTLDLPALHSDAGDYSLSPPSQGQLGGEDGGQGWVDIPTMAAQLLTHGTWHAGGQ